MSFPPYPEKFNTFYNTGYKQFWGSGFPYIKDDFVGGYAGLQYPSDDEDKVRQKPVMDLQNIAGRGRGTGRPKKKGKGFLSDLLGTVGSTLGAIGKPIFESVPALKPFEGLLGDNSLYGLASQGLKHIGLGKKKGGRKMLAEDDPRYEPDVKIQPYEVFGKVHKVYPHDIPRSRIRKRSKSVESMEGEGADPELLRAVHKYRKENKVSLAEAWKKVKEEMNFEKKVRQKTGKRKGRPYKLPKVMKSDDLKLLSTELPLTKREISELPKPMKSDLKLLSTKLPLTKKEISELPKPMKLKLKLLSSKIPRPKKKGNNIKASDVMKYKHKTGVSLKQAWADLKNEDVV
jgi:hypothetical protein